MPDALWSHRLHCCSLIHLFVFSFLFSPFLFPSFFLHLLISHSNGHFHCVCVSFSGALSPSKPAVWSICAIIINNDMRTLGAEMGLRWHDGHRHHHQQKHDQHQRKSGLRNDINNCSSSSSTAWHSFRLFCLLQPPHHQSIAQAALLSFPFPSLTFGNALSN